MLLTKFGNNYECIITSYDEQQNARGAYAMQFVICLVPHTSTQRHTELRTFRIGRQIYFALLNAQSYVARTKWIRLLAFVAVP